MKRRRKPTPIAEFYDRAGALSEIDDQDAPFALDGELRRAILHGERVRRLKNVTIKLDPVQIQALRKIATRRSVPFRIRP